MGELFRIVGAMLVALALVGSPLAAAPGGAAPAPSTPAPSSPAASGAAGLAAPTGTGPSCAITGYTPRRGSDARSLRQALLKQTANDATGTRLERAEAWVVPPDSQPTVVIDSETPIAGGRSEVYLFGVAFPLLSGSGEPRQRYVSYTTMPHLGSTVRLVGIRGESPGCSAEVVLIADRSVFGTTTGRAGLASAAICAALMLWLARRRSGGWLRRCALAAPFGLIAGAGEAAVLQEAGVISPFSRVGWALPVLGLLFAALLPLTRRRPGTRNLSTGSGWQAPYRVGPDRYRVEAPFTRTAAGSVDRAVHVETGERVLLKTVHPELDADPGAAARLRREVEVAGRLDDPHCLKLRESLPGVLPVLVFADVEGLTARQVLDQRGRLTGPQSCVVATGALNGLAAVHAAGLVHRDVRPDNIYLDVDGRVLLANFEVTVPGSENTVVAEAEPVYAGGEQRLGEIIDGRADLHAVGITLTELLTGRSAPDATAGLPAAIAALIAAATADDPDERPTSADAMRDQLARAAEDAYGPDWARIGALTGAALLPAGVIVGGAFAHGTAGSLAAGATAGSGTAGAGAVGAALAGAEGTGVAGGGLLGAGAGTGTAGAGASSATAGGAAAAGSGASKIGALVTPVLVVAVVAAVGLSGTADAAPPVPRELITPEAARVIFVNTVAEVRRGTVVHVAESARERATRRFGIIFADPASRLNDISVGVPPAQFGYPAYFLASASVNTARGATHILARFERAGADRPWLMAQLRTWDDLRLAPLAVTPDGYLRPSPRPGDLIMDPAGLPARYLDWLRRSEAADTMLPDPLFAPAYDDMLVREFAETDNWSDTPADKALVSWRYSDFQAGAVGDLVPFADGTVFVTFQVSFKLAYWNRVGQVSGSCRDRYLTIDRQQRPRYRSSEIQYTVDGRAWIPVRGAAPASDPPAAGPASGQPGPGPSASGPVTPRPTLAAPDRVTIDDTTYIWTMTASEVCTDD